MQPLLHNRIHSGIFYLAFDLTNLKVYFPVGFNVTIALEALEIPVKLANRIHDRSGKIFIEYNLLNDIFCIESTAIGFEVQFVT